MRFIGILGIITLLGIAFLMSNNRRKINLRTVAWGLILQMLFAAIILGASALSYFAMMVFFALIIVYIFKDEVNAGFLAGNPVFSAVGVILLAVLSAVVFYFLSLAGVLGWIWWILFFAIIIKAMIKVSHYQKHFVAVLLTSGYVWLFTHDFTGEKIFAVISHKVERFLSLSDLGAEFLFGNLALKKHFFPGSDTWPGFGFQFGFSVLPVIIFFASFMSILYHLGVMQKIIRWMARFMQWTMGTSGAETLSCSANIFVGQTEAPLLIRPFLNDMTLSKLKELSLIRTSPKARLPIRTIIIPYDTDVIKDAINREVDRGGQVFFVHNRVQTIDGVVAELKKLLPHVSFGVGHGQLPEKILEAVTLDFVHHKFDVLVATTIIESGIDIPNANTIIVNRADMFGLAQLYQIRGRVGRSNRRAYAYLIIPPKLHTEARKRLETLIEYESLGSGYQIAMRDMELRGAGTLLGTKQSGIINSIGFNYYNRLLEKTIENIQSEKPKELWIEEESQKLERIRIESDHYFPENYISSEKERLEIYRKMLALTKPDQFDDLRQELFDRFGEIPQQAKNAILYYKMHLMAKLAGLESVKMKKGNIALEFSGNKLLPREKLTRLVKHFNYPVRFDTTKNFKIYFEVTDTDNKSKLEIAEKSIEILNFIIAN